MYKERKNIKKKGEKVMTTIKIAPNANEIKREGTSFITDFNGMHIVWQLPSEYAPMSKESEQNGKECLSCAIAMSSKLYQAAATLDRALGTATKFYVNGNEIAH